MIDVVLDFLAMPLRRKVQAAGGTQKQSVHNIWVFAGKVSSNVASQRMSEHTHFQNAIFHQQSIYAFELIIYFISVIETLLFVCIF